MKTKLFLFFALPFYATSLLGSIHYIQEESLPRSPQELYIELVKKAVANTLYEDPNITGTYDAYMRENGLDFPKNAHTMVGKKRLDNIQACLEDILANNVPGDCIETGVWRGGSTILMRAILKAYNDQTRRVWVADSFEGLPPPNVDKYPQDLGLDLSTFTYLAVDLETVKNNFKKYDLLDNQVVFIKGLFSETLATAPINKISLLRLDGDLYESTMDALTALYPKLSLGGYIIVDDFGAIAACRFAIDDFRRMNGINDPIIWVDHTGIYWKKTH